MMEAFMSEHTNPALYKEMEAEFEAAFKASTSGDVVDEAQFNALMDKMDEHGK